MTPSSPSLRPDRAATGRPRFEVADIFRAHGAAFRQHHALSLVARKAMSAIECCRTEVLGGHLDVCASCGHGEPSYNSCRNRHCPKCQGLRQAVWLAGRKARILPTHYFHVVFTLPAELRALCRRNPVALYDLLFSSASQTLSDFASNEWGAQLGLTAVLHTWTRDLRLHPHLHCVVTGGGLDVAGDRWVGAGPRFLFPVKALARCFRGKLLCALKALHGDARLEFDDACGDLADPAVFQALVNRLFAVDWVVYAKRPFGGPEQVFEYLGRYTHRVAISNPRIVAVSDEEVRFRTRDGGHAALSPEQFIGRFLLHILPARFVKIRHYGLLAAGHVNTRLVRARERLAANHLAPTPTTAATDSATAPAPSSTDWRARLLALTGIDVTRCARCGGLRQRHGLAKVRPARPDTS